MPTGKYDRSKVKTHGERITKECPVCHKSFRVLVSQSDHYVTCGAKECSLTWRSWKMTKRNLEQGSPMKRKEVRQKQSATLRQRYKDGLEPTILKVRNQPSPEEHALFKLLEPHGWVFQHKVFTKYRNDRGQFVKGLPPYYALDIAKPELKLYVEVDGTSHDMKGAKKKDMRRDVYLDSDGWRGARFTADSVRENPQIIAQHVLDWVDTLG